MGDGVITYWIDRKSETVFVSFTGNIKIEDLLRHELKVVADTDFGVGFHTYADFSSATPFVVTEEATIEKCADFIRTLPSLRGRFCMAIYAPHDDTLGFCDVLASTAEGSGVEIRVFRREEEAQRWLGI
jgi:hypothetical protein